MTLTVVLLVLAAAYLAGAVWSYRRASGLRVVRCPVTRETVRVDLDAVRAGILLAPASEIVVRRCSLWPQRRDCAQWCCDDIQSSPDGCRMEAILASWYVGKRCAFCDRPMPRPTFGEIMPALRAPDGRIVEWSALDPTRLFEVLATHKPVCASCDVAETFRATHGDWVIERPRPEDDAAPRA